MQASDICICGQDRSVHAQGFGAALNGHCLSFRLASHAPANGRTREIPKGDETCKVCNFRFAFGGVCPNGHAGRAVDDAAAGV